MTEENNVGGLDILYSVFLLVLWSPSNVIQKIMVYTVLYDGQFIENPLLLTAK